MMDPRLALELCKLFEQVRLKFGEPGARWFISTLEHEVKRTWT